MHERTNVRMNGTNEGITKRTNVRSNYERVTLYEPMKYCNYELTRVHENEREKYCADERKYRSKKEAKDKLVKVLVTSIHTLYFVEPVSFLSSAAAVAFNRISSYLSSKASYKDKTRIL